MTFIIAIQLEDSVVVAADHRITIENNTTDNCYADSLQKIRFWQQGIITGTGESLTLERIFQIFQQDHNPQHLPALLYESCKYRQQEIGLHPQLAKTRLLYSQATEKGICLKTIGRDSNGISVHAIEPMSIELFVFNEDIDPIYHELIELQQHLCNPASFDCLSRWINYYTVALTSIFKKFSQVDHTVSASFDIYFQTPTQQSFLTVGKSAQ